jgi:hypothetical protein
VHPLPADTEQLGDLGDAHVIVRFHADQGATNY